MINVSRVVNRADFSQPFTIRRTSGTWVKGVFVTTPTDVPSYGSIQVAKERDLLQVPEGDRVMGAIKVYSTSPIYTTRSSPAGVSDVILWQGEEYRVAAVFPWGDFGYVKAIAVRTAGN